MQVQLPEVFFLKTYQAVLGTKKWTEQTEEIVLWCINQYLEGQQIKI